MSDTEGDMRLTAWGVNERTADRPHRTMLCMTDMTWAKRADAERWLRNQSILRGLGYEWRDIMWVSVAPETAFDRIVVDFV